MVNDLEGEREASSARAVAREIEQAGGHALVDGGDVRDAAQMEAMAAKVLAQWGRIDILVNNAGILRDKSFAKMSLGDFRLVLDVHVMGAANCTKAAGTRCANASMAAS